jgi:hypothetical protein
MLRDSYMKIVEQCAWMLEYVPEHIKTLEFCKEAVKKEGLALSYIPEEFKTAEFYMEVVKERCNMLFCVPERFRTPEICHAALNKYPDALEHVPDHIKTFEICREAVWGYSTALEFVPERFMTEELCLYAVEKGFGYELCLVPEHLKTMDVCLEAVKFWGSSFEYVPDALKEAVKKAVLVILHGGVMRDMQKAYEFIHGGLCNFYYLCAAMREEFKDETITRINERIANAKEIADSLKESGSELPKTGENDAIAANIKLWSKQLDINVNLVNSADIPVAYKNEYKELMDLVSWFKQKFLD